MIDPITTARLVGQLEGINYALQQLPTTPENVDTAAKLVVEMQRVSEQLETLEAEDKRQLAFWGPYEGN